MIKEYCENSQVAIIRSSHYGNDLDMLVRFYNEAVLDYPNLKIEDVRVVKYGGRYYKGTFGIEFNVGYYAPESYRRVPQLEFTM